MVRVPLCVRVSRVSRVCPGSPRCLFTGKKTVSVISRSRTPKPLTSAPPGTRRRAVTDAVGLAPSLLPRLGAVGVAISVTTTALVCGDRVSGLRLCFVHCGGDGWRRVRGPGVRDTTILYTTMKAPLLYTKLPRGACHSEYAKLLPYAIGSLRHL